MSTLPTLSTLLKKYEALTLKIARRSAERVTVHDQISRGAPPRGAPHGHKAGEHRGRRGLDHQAIEQPSSGNQPSREVD